MVYNTLRSNQSDVVVVVVIIIIIINFRCQTVRAITDPVSVGTVRETAVWLCFFWLSLCPFNSVLHTRHGRTGAWILEKMGGCEMGERMDGWLTGWVDV